ncbi:hypothetical protein SLS53_008291 [Cytospora paraplurivora]|uniref:Uncharacterized protein n=1 Tax=Cytospora paraplurivora TaxID=2898453 RepID=A0AAN9U1I7_9PEZI
MWSTPSACRDRGWFTEYTPFQSITENIFLSSPGQDVEGLGTVELRVERSPDSGDYTVLRLTSVLHTPSLLSNVIGQPIVERYRIVTGGGGGAEGIYDGEERIAYFDPGTTGRLRQPRVCGPPVGPPLGPSTLDGLQHFVVGVRWPEEERERWEAFQARPVVKQLPLRLAG